MGGRLPSDGSLITIKDIHEANACGKVKHGVKLVGNGEHLENPVNIEVTKASESAIKAVEDVGGSVTTVWLNRLALRAHMKPEKFDIIPRRARPPPKKMAYYTDWKNRGYLSPEAQARKHSISLGASDNA